VRVASATVTGCRSQRRRCHGQSRPAGRAGRSSRPASRTPVASSQRCARSLAFARFNTQLLLDEDDAIATALSDVDGIDAAAVVAALDSAAVNAAYEADKAQARSAAGGPTEFQGKAAVSDGLVRYTAPSVVFEADGRHLEAGGFQPIEAYDVLIANLDATLERFAPPEGPAELLKFFTEGLCTQEVAALLAGNLVDPDRVAAESALIELVGAGGATREPVGSDAIWRAAVVGSDLLDEREQRVPAAVG